MANLLDYTNTLITLQAGGPGSGRKPLDGISDTHSALHGLMSNHFEHTDTNNYGGSKVQSTNYKVDVNHFATANRDGSWEIRHNNTGERVAGGKGIKSLQNHFKG